MADPILPRAQSLVLDARGYPTREWYDFFRDLLALAGVQTNLEAQILALAQAVAELQAATPDLGQLFGDMSVAVDGLLGQVVQLRLVNDTVSPGDTHYYGTNADGTKGWYQRFLATLADVDLTGLADSDLLRWDATAERWVVGQAVESVVATAGETTVDNTDPNNPIVGLADVANVGTGALLALTRDGKGRLAGTRAVVAGDLTPILDSEYDSLGSAAAALTAANDYTDDEIAGYAGDTHTWALTQTFTVPPVFTDAAGTRTALGLGTMATASATDYLALAGGTMAANILFSPTAFAIQANTTDGSDTLRLALAGGGGTSVARGGYILLHGADHATFPGEAQIHAATGCAVVLNPGVGASCRPNSDNTRALGEPSFRWASLDVVTVNLSGAEYHTGSQAVSLTANTDNQTVNAATRTVRITSNNAYNLTGLTGGAAGRRLTLLNTSAFTITLTHDATSTAANRFLCPNNTNVAVRQNGSVDVIYDATSSRWRVIGA